MRTRQILIRVSEDEHRRMALKARAAGVSIQALVREQVGRIHGTKNGAYLRTEQVLLARIGCYLTVIAERCRGLDDKASTMEILTRLISIEGELRERAKVREAVC